MLHCKHASENGCISTVQGVQLAYLPTFTADWFVDPTCRFANLLLPAPAQHDSDAYIGLDKTVDPQLTQWLAANQQQPDALLPLLPPYSGMQHPPPNNTGNAHCDSMPWSAPFGPNYTAPSSSTGSSSSLQLTMCNWYLPQGPGVLAVHRCGICCAASTGQLCCCFVTPPHVWYCAVAVHQNTLRHTCAMVALLNKLYRAHSRNTPTAACLSLLQLPVMITCAYHFPCMPAQVPVAGAVPGEPGLLRAAGLCQPPR